MSAAPAPAEGRVLAVGVYLTARENNAVAIAGELGRSRRFAVEQRWIALGEPAPPAELEAVTAEHVRTPSAKFALLDGLLARAPLAPFDFVLVCDDDIRLPEAFVDRYLDLVIRHDLALAQPARTHESFIDHPFVEQLDGLDARRTRFVEIGPLFSVRRDAFAVLFPFGGGSPMGWGFDLAWPVAIERAGLRMGIVDATPVAHDLRRPAAAYDVAAAQRTEQAFLSGRPHLSRDEAFTILEAYA